MSTIIPLVFTASWASGINPYLFTLLAILGGRAGVIDVPEGLMRTDVLIAVAVLTVLDTVVGKTALLDSVWDAVNTFIRPVVGAVSAVLIADPTTELATAFIAASGGTVALITHLAKASVRLGVNTSPEPASNIAVGVVEDTLVVLAVLVAVVNPYLAAAVALAALTATILAAVLAAGATKKAINAIKARVANRHGPGSKDEPQKPT